MNRKAQRRTGRWSERPAQVEVTSPYKDSKPVVLEPRRADLVFGPGPYESSYDIALGYSHDRSIVVP